MSVSTARSRRRRLRDDARSHWLFFRQWMRAPLKTASMVPSSKYLGDAMARALPPEAKRVVELGPGTGAITECLLQHGISPDGLLVVELNPTMHAQLLQRFPDLHIVQADAQELPALLAHMPNWEAGTIDAVVSGLGFLSMPDHIVKNILQACFAVMGEAGKVIVFTYGPRAPVPPALLRSLKLRADKQAFVLRNLPPATVYVLSRRQS